MVVDWKLELANIGYMLRLVNIGKLIFPDTFPIRHLDGQTVDPEIYAR